MKYLFLTLILIATTAQAQAQDRITIYPRALTNILSPATTVALDYPGIGGNNACIYLIPRMPNGQALPKGSFDSNLLARILSVTEERSFMKPKVLPTGAIAYRIVKNLRLYVGFFTILADARYGSIQESVRQASGNRPAALFIASGKCPAIGGI